MNNVYQDLALRREIVFVEDEVQDIKDFAHRLEKESPGMAARLAVVCVADLGRDMQAELKGLLTKYPGLVVAGRWTDPPDNSRAIAINEEEATQPDLTGEVVCRLIWPGGVLVQDIRLWDNTDQAEGARVDRMPGLRVLKSALGDWAVAGRYGLARSIGIDGDAMPQIRGCVVSKQVWHFDDYRKFERVRNVVRESKRRAPARALEVLESVFDGEFVNRDGASWAHGRLVSHELHGRMLAATIGLVQWTAGQQLRVGGTAVRQEVSHGLETNMAKLWFCLVKDGTVSQADTTPPDIHKLSVEQLRFRTDLQLEKEKEKKSGSGEYVLNTQLSRGFVKSWRA